MAMQARRPRRLSGSILLWAFVACALLLAAADLRAEDEPKKDTSKTPKASAPHLAFRKTYAEALFEARVRNLPVLVSRHKDF